MTVDARSDTAPMRLPFFAVTLLAFTATATEPDAGSPTPIEVPSFTAHVPTGHADAGEVEIKGKLGEGLTVKTGDFALNIRGRMQLQAASVFPGVGTPSSARVNQIFVRRARLAIKADVGSSLSLNLQLAFAPPDLDPEQPSVLRDYYLQWTRFRDVSVRAGQMKVPFDVQRVVSSSSLQMVDRSAITAEFNLDRDMGLTLYSDDIAGWGKRLRYAVGVFGGDGRGRVGTNVGLLYVGRVRFSPLGELDDKVEGDVERDAKFRFAIGGAIARNVQTVRQRSTIGSVYKLGAFTYDHATVDAHVKVLGFSLLSEFFFRSANEDVHSAITAGTETKEYSRSGLGFFVQAGQYVTPWLELSARYGELFPRENTDPGFHHLREIGGGAGFFLAKHAAKLQADYFYLDDGAGQSVKHQVRVQAQLSF